MILGAKTPVPTIVLIVAYILRLRCGAPSLRMTEGGIVFCIFHRFNIVGDGVLDVPQKVAYILRLRRDAPSLRMTAQSRVFDEDNSTVRTVRLE